MIQIPLAFEYLFEPSRFKVGYGGRGSGKSWAFAQALLILGTQSPCRILCTREFQNSIKDSVKNLLDKQIDRMGLGSFYHSLQDSIVGINGTQFLFYGIKTNITKIKSLEGIKYAWVEEAQTISQLSIDVLIPTIRAEESEIWFTFNPYLIEDPVYDMFVVKGRPDAVTRLVNYYDNPFFPEVLEKEKDYCKEHDPIKFNNVWLGELTDLSDSLVFNNWSVGETKEPKDGQYYFGLDLGYSVSPNALVKVSIDEENRVLYIHDEGYGPNVEIDDLADFIATLPGAVDNYITADSSRPETISHLNKRGLHIIASKKGPGSIKEGIEFLKNFKIVIHPKCKHTIYDFGHYSHEVDPKTNLIRPDRPPVKKDENFIDAVRYAIERVRNSGHFSVI